MDRIKPAQVGAFVGLALAAFALIFITLGAFVSLMADDECRNLGYVSGNASFPDFRIRTCYGIRREVTPLPATSLDDARRLR